MEAGVVLRRRRGEEEEEEEKIVKKKIKTFVKAAPFFLKKALGGRGSARLS